MSPLPRALASPHIRLTRPSVRSEKDTSIHGSVRITLQAPEEQITCATPPCGRGKVPRKIMTDLDYCLNSCSDPGAGDCTGDYNQDVLLCPAVYSNAAFVQYPSLEGQGAVFLTTRVDSVNQRVGPPDNTKCQQDPSSAGSNPSDLAIRRSSDKSCSDWHTVSNQSWYISQIEDYLVKIDHSMLATNVALTRTGYQMDDGEMLAHTDEDGDLQGVRDDDPVLVDPCDDFEPKSSCPTPEKAGTAWGVNVGDKLATDVVKVKTLLRAAGLSPNALDERGASDHRRLRHRGIVLMLNIDYDNTYSSVWGLYPNTDKYRYRYSVINVPDEGYQVPELHSYDQSEGTRTMFYRHGIRIVLRQTGSIGAFSFASALTTCTTSLGLFAVSSLIVDWLLEHLKRFNEYEKHKLLATDKHSEKTLRDGLLDVKSTLTSRLSRGGSDQNIELQSTGGAGGDEPP